MAGIYKSDAGRQAIEAFYRKALARWPLANEHMVVPTRHGETFVIACGPADAPPLLLLHGSGTNSAVWIRDVAVWAQHHHVFAIDIIGEPGLSAQSRPPLRSAAYTEWLDDIYEGVDVTSASLVGVSLGAWLALDYAVKRPERVTSLSLLSPAGIGRRKQLFMLKAGVLLLLGKFGVDKALSAASGKTTVSAPVAQYMRLIFENFRPRREAPPIVSNSRIAALTMPIQVIVGANDAMLHATGIRDRVARLLPHAELTFLAGAGHMLPPQTPAVADFLARLKTASARQTRVAAQR